MLRKLLNLISPAKAASGVGFSPFAREQYLDELAKHGIEAHLYLPSVGNRDNETLCRALDAMSNAGYLMTDSNGNLIGKLARARLSANEKAIERRAEFKVID